MIQNLKSEIMKANRLYRDGKPIITDEQYDTLLEKLQSKISEQEYQEFQKTILEAEGKIQLPFVVGSLNKCTYGTDQFKNWQKKYNVGEIFCADKIDGMAFIAYYENGSVQKVYSRGNGILGEDITEKCLNIFPKTIPQFKSWVRGELLLTEEGRIKFNYENRRNGTVGLMLQKEYDINNLNFIEVFFHGMPNTDSDICKQLLILKDNFPNNVVKFFSIRENHEECLLEQIKRQESESYIADGIVIYKWGYKNENVYHPELARAFKVNKEGVVSTVTGIKWNVSKNGNIKPVVQIEPVKIDGTTVKQVTGYNYKWLIDNGINIGAKVKVLKAGEIIPKIVEVIEESNNKEYITECPSCNSELIKEGVELKCISNNCDTTSYKSLATFLRQCGVEGISWVGLKNYEFKSVSDILNWKPDFRYKTDEVFYNELLNKVFTKSEEALLGNFSYDGFGKRSIDEILKVYSINEFYYAAKNNEYNKNVYGISKNGLMEMQDCILKNFDNLELIINDSRYNPKEKVEGEIKQSSITGKKFIITGTLSKPRKYFEDIIKTNGGIIANGVNKELDFLIVGESAGSKLTKAQQLNISILNEQQFMETL